LASKILYTTTSYLPAIGGAQLHTHQIIRYLSTRHAVKVVTLWDHNRTDWLLGTTLNAPPKPKTYSINNIPVSRITLTTGERWQLWPYVLGYYVFMSLAIDRIAAKFVPKIESIAQDVDLIHNVRIGREPLSFASLHIARKLDIPFVFVPYHHPRWVGWHYREYLNLYRQADALIALTHVEKQTLVSLGVAEERIFVIGNGPIIAEQADPDRFRKQLSLPRDVPLILFLGQKYRYKGFQHLAQAAPLVWDRFPEAYFLFIGPSTRFSRNFFAHQSDPRLIELGTVDLQEKTDALAACTLLCLPSSQESFGGVFTEAWTFAKPVIGADIPAVREVIDNDQNGYVVSPTAEAIAEKICFLLANPAVAVQLGQAGRAKTLHQYNWDRLAQKTEEIYTKVLRG
jgi:glycosyltransferase involved in cell wall biosynthesis